LPGEFVQRHIQENYPRGVVLVISAEELCRFDQNLLAEAIVNRPFWVFCREFSGIVVFRFLEEVDVPVMAERLRKIAGGPVAATLYRNGEPVCDLD